MTRSPPGGTRGSAIGMRTAASVVITTVPVSSMTCQTQMPRSTVWPPPRSSTREEVSSVRSSTASAAAMSRADASST